MKTIYWAVLLVMLHTWAGYLLLLLIISHFKRPKATKQYIYPYVTVLLTVHNEEKLIENRIKNLLETDYPQDLLEILVASDGSNDNTDKIVMSMGKTDSKISLLAVKRCGKSAAQNKAIPLLKGEIIVLTDAETVFERDSIKNLVRNFSRNEVGCASGRLILTSQDYKKFGEQGGNFPHCLWPHNGIPKEYI
jgi:cellulose synthase/poly-beta-1,6-N-acetylglucosamine synthase-like glycosyltransferase